MARKTFPIVLGDRTFLLDFDWPALSQIYRDYGPTRDLFDPEVLGGIVLIGLKRHHPDVTADTLTAASPPIVQVVAAVDRALRYAYDGVDTAEEPPAPATPPAASPEAA
ncbi:hypothetical protein IGS68_35180 (plasmid) [Skermanella sp. TT6]|uniref:Tail tube GTA-gp10-like protein n=1 Tax=Skermanella cutis TaxID=2775420 RepID=A0ABX7BK36_9PROT|nr:hypothetical protein [Skermanella sp. TT6]QQP94056.1 hypothetical protein IGS68_35180 [Skermanella sp. TT6]